MLNKTPIAWPEAQRICDIPEVREALDKFAAEAHDENMLTMVSAIMGHAVTQGRAAGLEEAKEACRKGGLDFSVRLITELQAEDAPTISPTPSDAGKDDPIIATWPAEIWLQAGDEPLGHYSEYEDVTWCRIPQGESDVRYVRASSLEVIGKGEKK
ncbi:hypothetical protein FEE59_13570 [Herbaspirillum sp. RU 5E]|nr:hypothetical protein [Herbaspirillum sp. RU 5E]